MFMGLNMFTLFMISVLTLPQLPLIMCTNLILICLHSELFSLVRIYTLTPLFRSDNQLALNLPCPPYLHFRCCLGHFYALTLVVKAAAQLWEKDHISGAKSSEQRMYGSEWCSVMMLSILAAEIRCQHGIRGSKLRTKGQKEELPYWSNSKSHGDTFICGVSFEYQYMLNLSLIVIPGLQLLQSQKIQPSL